MRFHMPLFEKQSGSEPRNVDGNSLPPATRDYLKVAANRIGHTAFEKRAGLSLKAAHKTLCSLADRLVPNPDNTWQMPPDWTDKEFAVLKCVVSLIVSKPAFEPKVLTEGFLDTLKSYGLLTREEVRQHRNTLSHLIQLFAISVMHRTKVIMEDGDVLPINAYVNAEERQIQLLCAVNVPLRGKNIAVSAPIFVADLDAFEHCHPDLLEGDGEIKGDLEISSEGELVPL
ncbi:hypothetical protein CN933_03185 [Sinorhizobium sp. M4_45]|nr:hypothetical protein CN933_03185 [Sinorhizobium sp. M4_45]